MREMVVLEGCMVIDKVARREVYSVGIREEVSWGLSKPMILARILAKKVLGGLYDVAQTLGQTRLRV